MVRSGVIALAAFALAACGRGQNDERDQAAGQILPGSASDAMLQTDRLQSEAPLAKPEANREDAGNGTKAKGNAPISPVPAPSPDGPAGERPPLPEPTASSGPAIDPNVAP